MSNFQFTKATKRQLKLRMALDGPTGSGKTYSALNIGTNLGKRIAVIDTEHGSASKYSDIFNFDVLELLEFSPETYTAAIHAAEAAGYDVLIIDSLSHAWMGKGGALEQVDNVAKRSQSNNSYIAWREVTPLHNEMVEAILASPCHIIATMRAKMEYALDKDKDGKMQVTKIGLAPIQRDGVEYEFDVVGDLNLQNDLIVSKTRCSVIYGKIFKKPGKDIAAMLKKWLEDGAPVTIRVYGDTSRVNGNPDEQKAFDQYLSTFGKSPASKDELRGWVGSAVKASSN